MKKQLNIVLAADLHYFPAAMAGGFNQAFKDDNYDVGKPAEQSEAIVQAMLQTLAEKAKQDGLDYLVIAGDLTRNGEYEAHVRLAGLLEEFQRKSGVSVLLAPGNHDLNNPEASDYRSGEKQPAQRTSAIEFHALYQNLYPQGARHDSQNPCNFAFDLNEDYTLIAIDTCRYDEHGHSQVRGEITQKQMDWILAQCACAKQSGRVALGLMHHNLAEHVPYQAAAFKGYLLDDYLRVRETLADAGMRFCFTGHMHRGSNAQAVSDSGNLLVDISAPTLYAFPCEIVDIMLERRGKKVTAQTKLIPADPSLDPAESYRFSFCGSQGGGVAGFCLANVRKRLPRILSEIAQAGGLHAFLVQNGMQNNSGALRAVCAQLDARYIKDPEHTVKLVCRIVSESLRLRMSTLPSKRYLESLGLGHQTRPGTLENFLETGAAMVYWRGDINDDPFMQDALENLRNGTFVDQVLRFAIDKIVDDLLSLRPNPSRKAKLALQAAMGLLISLSHRRAISKVLEWTAREYFGKPTTGEDIIVHKGQAKVQAREDEFRKPMDVQVKLSADKCCATITWFTKESVTASDLALYHSDTRCVPKQNVTHSVMPEPFVARKLDLGLAKIMGHEIPANKHTVTISGLVPGRYVFRVGDSARAWLSPWQMLNTSKLTRSAHALKFAKGTASTAARLLNSFRLVDK